MNSEMQEENFTERQLYKRNATDEVNKTKESRNTKRTHNGDRRTEKTRRGVHPSQKQPEDDEEQQDRHNDVGSTDGRWLFG